VGYSVDMVINFASELISKTFRGIYPVEVDSLVAFAMLGAGRQFSTANEIFSVVEPEVAKLEKDLTHVNRTTNLTGSSSLTSY
jgi:hypothetical protein